MWCLITRALLALTLLVSAPAMAQFGYDPDAQGLALQAKTSATTLARLQRLLRAAQAAQVSNPHSSGAYVGATVTDREAVVPTETPTNYAITFANRGVFNVVGGRLRSDVNSILSARNNETGNASADSSPSYGRFEVMANSRYIAWTLSTSTVPYRFIVDGKYIDTAGTITTVNGTTHYVLIDFGTRAVRRVVVEVQQSGQVVNGARVESTGRLYPVDTSTAAWAVYLGDSFIQGAAINRGDIIPVVLGDWLGLNMQASGVGGTGWDHPTNPPRNFLERIQAGDLGLAYQAPDIIFLMGSVNDSARTASVIQSRATAGIAEARRQYPGVPIIVFGVHNVPGKVLSGTPSLTSDDQAVQAAVASFTDPLLAFVPVLGDTTAPYHTGDGGQLIFTAALTGATSGTLANAWCCTTASYTILFSDGSTRSATLTQNSTAVSWTGAVTATAQAASYTTLGSSSWTWQYDRIHPTVEGAAYIGRREAQAAVAALRTMAAGLGL